MSETLVAQAQETIRFSRDPKGEELYPVRQAHPELTYAAIGALCGLTGDQVSGRIRRFLQSPPLPEKPPAPRVEFVDPPAGRSQPLADASAAEPTATSREKLEVSGDTNTQEIDSRSERITTLEQLLAFCQVDLETWAVDHYVINKWEVGRKALTKELSWVDGIISGHEADTGDINIRPLYQVKVWLVRKVPVKVKPVISPVMVQLAPLEAPPPRRKFRAALCLPDPQIGFRRDLRTGKLSPFHDRRALDACLQIAQVLQPEDVYWLGDVVDNSAWSDKFMREPGFYFTTQASIIEGAWIIARFRTQARVRSAVLEGNHDARPEKMLINHMVEAYGLKAADQLESPAVMSLDNLLGLSRMDVEYYAGYPDAEIWLNKAMRITHGEKVRGQPGQTAAAVVRDSNESVVFGHVHRRELATKTIPERNGVRLVTAYSPGCLCHIDGRVPGGSKRQQWQQGACVIFYDDRCSSIVPIDILDGVALFQGEAFQGRDYTRELRRDSGWDF